MKTLILLAAGFLSISIGSVEAEYYTLDTEKVHGKLKAVYSDFFTVTTIGDSKSNDVNLDQRGELSFKIDGQTHFKNVDELDDLKEGDEIEVRYRHEDGQNVANFVTLEDRAVKSSGVRKKTTTTVTTTTTTYPNL